MRRRALKKVQELMGSLENKDENVETDRNIEVGLDEASGGCEEMHTDSEEESGTTKV